MVGGQDSESASAVGRRNASRQRWLLIAALCVCAALGCGVRGPPRPPDAPVTQRQVEASRPSQDTSVGDVEAAGVQDCEACELRERALFD